MLIRQLHPWNIDINQAKTIQLELQQKIVLCPLKKSTKLIAGADVSYSLKDQLFFAAIVILRYPDLIEIESAVARGKVTFPYVPGFLTFREAPVLLKAFEKIKHRPDVVMFDGQGIAHPRSVGVATHLGIILNIPTIGCAKSRLIGNHNLVPEDRGATVPLKINNKIIGAVVRTRSKVKPIYISPGYKITLNESVDIVLKTSPKYRIPEPTRKAHLLVNQLRKISYKKLVA